MYSKISFIAVFIIAIVLAYRCSVALQVPTDMDAQKANTPLDTLIAGRELYISKCNSCHSLYLPEKYNKKQWKLIINKMQKPAKINDKQATLIYQFVSSKCKE